MKIYFHDDINTFGIRCNLIQINLLRVFHAKIYYVINVTKKRRNYEKYTLFIIFIFLI